MANGTEHASRRITPGAVFGILFGSSAWALLFATMVVASGRTELLIDCVLPVVFAAVVIALLLLALLQWKASLAPGTPGAGLLVQGGLASAIGLVLVLADGFVTPVLEADSRLADTMRLTGSLIRVPIWLALIALLVGGAMLAVALRRISRAS